MRDLLVLPAEGISLLAAAPLVELWSGTWPYLLMLLGFSLIVFVHELGHFMVAKWADVKVDRFAIGFGREIFGFTRGETRYSFNILPLGGYVKMLGQEDFDDKSKELQFGDDPRSFINKPVGRRMAIVSAGVVMNVLFACLVFMVVFLIGMEAIGTHIGFVEPDSPADRAGLLPGDKIVRINGERMLEFRDVTMAIQLAPPHEGVEFLVERGGKLQPPVYVKPDYRRPESTRDARRQVIGILYGFSREVMVVSPFLDRSREDTPHVGDLIAEVDGTTVTDENINQMRDMLAYAHEVYVERKDASNPTAPPRRVRVRIEPLVAIWPSDSRDRGSINVLGLGPLMRFDAVDASGRASLGGLEVGDTILGFDDVDFPDYAQITRSIRDNPERDVAYVVQKADGRIVEGFVRPKRVRFGAGTIQALCESVNGAGIEDHDETPEEPPSTAPTGTGPRAKFAKVRIGGSAARAGIANGDRIVHLAGIDRPSCGQVNAAIRNAAGRALPVVGLKADGSTLLTSVVPEESGSLDASYMLVADDVLRVGRIVESLAGRPSPAAKAGIPSGSRILRVEEKPIRTWVELIGLFREHAGTTVSLAYEPPQGGEAVAPFEIPRSLRTLLEVGPEARILSIDGQPTVTARTGRGMEEVHVGYHEGTRSFLTELIGRRQVPVAYRANPLSPVLTAHVDVTEDMVDPWLGRITFAPSVDIGPETTLLKGANALDAIRIGAHKTYQFILNVYIIIKRMVFSRTIGLESMSGPLGIVSIGGQIARAGLVEFLYFLAIISANLAVINFLPLPIVDGGLMVFLLIEKIKGSPVSLRVQVATQMIGLFLIIGVFLFVTYNDALRLWG